MALLNSTCAVVHMPSICGENLFRSRLLFSRAPHVLELFSAKRACPIEDFFVGFSPNWDIFKNHRNVSSEKIVLLDVRNDD